MYFISVVLIGLLHYMEWVIFSFWVMWGSCFIVMQLASHGRFHRHSWLASMPQQSRTGVSLIQGTTIPHLSPLKYVLLLMKWMLCPGRWLTIMSSRYLTHIHTYVPMLFVWFIHFIQLKLRYEGLMWPLFLIGHLILEWSKVSTPKTDKTITIHQTHFYYQNGQT